MKNGTLLFIGAIFYLLTGCIELYDPGEDELKTGTMVVVADLTTRPGIQSIKISHSSTLAYPEYNPVSGCYVIVESGSGTSRNFREAEPGSYCSRLDEGFLVTGENYRISFITPGGEQYESAFETLYPVSTIDSIYFLREDHPTRELGITEEGVQFYLDFEIEKDSARYLMWKLTETYEIHNPENEAWIFDVDRRLKELPDSSSWFTCWLTYELPDIYTMDLVNVEGDYFQELPLNYVSTDTRRLHYRYSLLVEQMAMSQAAFRYWDELGKNMQSQGNLFDIQPSILPGNICNVNNEEEIVIGYFRISDVSDMRIFVQDVPGLKIRKNPTYCAPGEFPKFLWRMHDKYLPVYLAKGYLYKDFLYGEVHKFCLDCRDYKGSSHIKPDYW